MNEDYKIAISKDALSEMPPVEFQGDITVVDTPEATKNALAIISRLTAVGIDTETRPNFRKGQNNHVALIQISSEDNTFLFRICHTGLLPGIIELLENPNIMKIGLSLKDDFHNLHKISEFTPHNVVELQQMVKNYRITDASLQKIYGILFGERISKGQRLTNWEAAELTDAQQRYASIDAWACLKIYNHLVSGCFRHEDSPYKVFPEPKNEEE